MWQKCSSWWTKLVITHQGEQSVVSILCNLVIRCEHLYRGLGLHELWMILAYSSAISLYAPYAQFRSQANSKLYCCNSLYHHNTVIFTCIAILWPASPLSKQVAKAAAAWTGTRIFDTISLFRAVKLYSMKWGRASTSEYPLLYLGMALCLPKGPHNHSCS